MCLDPQTRQGDNIDEEFRINNGEGEISWIHIRGRIFRNTEGIPLRMSGSFRDISKSKWAEAQLKEKNIELASGNEKGNTLTKEEVQQQVALAMQEEDFGFLLKDVDQILAECLEGTERISSIVQGLKSFARPDSDSLSAAQINDGLESTLRMIWSTVKYKCEVEKNLGNLPAVYCNIGHLNQVFMNLMANASHAIEENGRIGIKTRHEDGHIVIAISDNGAGISKEIQNRIFEPFFTTKPIGKGTGLGLSISHGIIEDHRGTISVRSQAGRGTTFTIRFPDNLGEIMDLEKSKATVAT